MSPALLKDIDTIVANATGPRSERAELMSHATDVNTAGGIHINRWANAIRARLSNPNLPSGGAFEGYSYGGPNIRESYSGNVLVISSIGNPIGKTATATGKGYSFYEPSRYSQALAHKGSNVMDYYNGNMGKVANMKYNKDQKILFLYVPDKSNNYKWTPVSAVTLS